MISNLWKPPPTPSVWTIPLPPTTPGVTSGSDYLGGYETTFLGGGNDHRQSTQEWTDALAQEAEASTSLAAAKPKDIQNNAQPGVGGFFYPARDRAVY